MTVERIARRQELVAMALEKIKRRTAVAQERELEFCETEGLLWATSYAHGKGALTRDERRAIDEAHNHPYHRRHGIRTADKSEEKTQDKG